MHERYVNSEGDEPLDSFEVTNAQLTALQAVISQGMAPYTDFGVWGPHGNRLARKQKFTNMHLDTSGKWHSSELSGPSNLEAWRASWAVFRTACIMLKIATPATLGRYESRFRRALPEIPTSTVCCRRGGRQMPFRILAHGAPPPGKVLQRASRPLIV